MSTSLLSQLRHWWAPTSSAELVHAETELLDDACVPSSRVKFVGSDGSRVRTLDLPGPIGAENLPPLVLLHGFGMGLAFWGRQLAEFQKHRRVIAIDLPGFGTSEGSNIDLKTIQEAEDFFISTLECWREHMEIRRMVLVGHGIGAYIAAVYSLRHNKRVEHLFMLSAAGMERRTKDQDIEEPFLLGTLWSRAMTPQAIVRICGGWLGKKITQNLARLRYRGEASRTIEHIGNYLYHLWARPSAAEAAVVVLMQLGSRWGRKPLVDRLHRLRCGVTFLYGEYDAVPHAAADDVLPRLSVPASVVLIPAAGTHAYMDNPARFNAVVLAACGTGRARPPSRTAAADPDAAPPDLFDPAVGAATPPLPARVGRPQVVRAGLGAGNSPGEGRAAAAAAADSEKISGSSPAAGGREGGSKEEVSPPARPHGAEEPARRQVLLSSNGPAAAAEVAEGLVVGDVPTDTHYLF